MHKTMLGILYLQNRISEWLSNRWNRFFLFIYGCKFGKGFRSHGRIRIRNNGIIRIGDNVTVNSSMMSNPLGGSSVTILISGKHGEIRIGNHVGISNATLFAQDCISIGDYTLLGAGVKIYDSDFHPIVSVERRNNEKPKCMPVNIGNDVFVGAHSILLKGVTIGDGSVIGAGSVVSKSVPSGEIWAGNPAHFIKWVQQ